MNEFPMDIKLNQFPLLSIFCVKEAGLALWTLRRWWHISHPETAHMTVVEVETQFAVESARTVATTAVEGRNVYEASWKGMEKTHEGVALES